MNNMQLKVKCDTSFINIGLPTSRLLEIELTAPEAASSHDAPPLNLALVIDRSGSMGGGKLEQAKDAVSQILDLMRPKDSVSIIDYDDHVRLNGECDSVSESARVELKSLLRALHTGGSTNLAGGWLEGCERVALRQSAGKVNRTLLLSDGLANVGITNPTELARHASAIFERGVATSTFGIGEDFDEHLLEAMANRGGGNFYYIARTSQIPALLMEEFKDLSAVTLKNVRIEIQFPAGVSFELFGEWHSETHGSRLIINLSDLPASRTVNLFVRLITPPGDGLLKMGVKVFALDEEDHAAEAMESISLQYAAEERVKLAESEKDADLVQRFSSVAFAQQATAALKLEKEGLREKAGKVMDIAMSEFGSNLPNSTRRRYLHRSEEMRVGLDESSRKNYQSDAYFLKRHRHSDQRGGEDKK